MNDDDKELFGICKSVSTGKTEAAVIIRAEELKKHKTMAARDKFIKSMFSVVDFKANDYSIFCLDNFDFYLMYGSNRGNQHPAKVKKFLKRELMRFERVADNVIKHYDELGVDVKVKEVFKFRNWDCEITYVPGHKDLLKFRNKTITGNHEIKIFLKNFDKLDCLEAGPI